MRCPVAVRGLELQPDVVVIEALEPLVRDWGARQVAAEPLEAVRIASTNRHIGVKVEPVGTRAARAELLAWMRDVMRVCWLTELVSPGKALFSSEERARRVTQEPLALAIGHRLLRNTQGEVDIDPGSVHHTVIDSAYAEHWRRAASGESILRHARALAMGLGSAEDLAALREHGAWHVVVRTEPRTQLAMAPDRQGRQLAALFSEADTAWRVRNSLDGPHEVQPQAAAQLFSQLQRLPLQGFVVDCAERSAVALAAAVLPMLANQA